jgi:hypothetical protein
MEAEESLLQKCKSLIEQKLGWDQSESWTNHDFQSLSAKIQDATGVNLSVATLKRLWGKVKYDSKPTITTLNTLAQFTGYENWRAFKQDQSSHTSNGSAKVNDKNLEPAAPVKTSGGQKKFLRSGLIGTALCGGIVFILLYMFRRDDVSEASASRYSFTSKKVVSEGVPNSVIFDYDASVAQTDTIYIQQSWDNRLRAQVSRDQHQHTSIYYTPGFFQAKLIVGKEVVKEHNLLITSKGWLALVQKDPVPVYFKDEDFRPAGMLQLPVEKLKASNILFHPDLPVTSYYNVKDFGDVRTDNFVFETQVKSDYNEGAGVCQRSQIMLLTEGSAIFIPLSIRGCVSDMSLMFGQYIDGKKADLSAFGCDPSQWVNVKIEVKEKKGRVMVNDKVAYETDYNGSEKIVGMVYHFQGTGSVNDAKITGADGKVVFSDAF